MNMRALKQYLYNWLFAADLFLNMVIGGDPRQTISSRMGMHIAAGRCWLCRPVCRALSLLDKDHCEKAWAQQLEPFTPSKQVTKQ